MGKRGPKPKPKAIALLEGNPGRRELVPDDLEVISELPAIMPASLEVDEIAAAEWRRVVAAMPPGLYSAADSAVLTLYAQSWSMLIRAMQEIDLNGLTILEDGKLKTNPAVKTWKAASENLLKTADRLGLSPGVRSRLRLPTRGEKPESKFAGLIAEQ